MNIAISNIAWNKEEDQEIAQVLKKHDIRGVEIAPTKIWDDPLVQTKETIKKYKDFWNTKGIEIVAVQSLLFGHPELTIFDDSHVRSQTIAYLSKMIHIASILGVQVMVFGSPVNRKRNSLPIEQAFGIAKEFFFTVASECERFGIYFCIEPNPVEYGADFINNTDEAVELVKAVNHSNFRLHLDSSAFALNNENYEESIEKGFPFLKHFHISEKHLSPIYEGTIPHKKIVDTLNRLQYKDWVSIEMRSQPDISSVELVDKALSFAQNYYV